MRRSAARLEVNNMRRLATITLVLLTTFSSAVLAQEPASAQQVALQKLLEEQVRRIEALEARLAMLQQQIDAMRERQPAPPVPVVEPHPPVPYEHAITGAPPDDPDSEEAVADLPRVLNVDAYGSL